MFEDEEMSHLTPRQIEILDLIKRGYAAKEVASRLGISAQTIKNHMSVIFRKLDAVNSVDAVIKAIKAGYISLDA